MSYFVACVVIFTACSSLPLKIVGRNNFVPKIRNNGFLKNFSSARHSDHYHSITLLNHFYCVRFSGTLQSIFGPVERMLVYFWFALTLKIQFLRF